MTPKQKPDSQGGIALKVASIAGQVFLIIAAIEAVLIVGERYKTGEPINGPTALTYLCINVVATVLTTALIFLTKSKK